MTSTLRRRFSGSFFFRFRNQEEASCRICFGELRGGGETFRKECSCKGDLSLAHKECIFKWFRIKGSAVCDVCQQEIKNFPTSLIAGQAVEHRQLHAYLYRVWNDVPILLLVSVLAYFCFSEQLLVRDMGAVRSVFLSLPIALGLAIFSSVISSALESKGEIWAYATFQFVWILAFACISFTLLNLNAVLSILLSTFTVYGIILPYHLTAC